MRSISNQSQLRGVAVIAVAVGAVAVGAIAVGALVIEAFSDTPPGHR